MNPGSKNATKKTNQLNHMSLSRPVRAIYDHFSEMEWIVAILWGIRGNYGVHADIWKRYFDWGADKKKIASK